MKSINVAAISPLFMSALFGTAAACLVLVLTVLASRDRSGAIYLIGGGLLYLVGTVLVMIQRAAE